MEVTIDVVGMQVLNLAYGIASQFRADDVLMIGQLVQQRSTHIDTIRDTREVVDQDWHRTSVCQFAKVRFEYSV